MFATTIRCNPTTPKIRPEKRQNTQDIITKGVNFTMLRSTSRLMGRKLGVEVQSAIRGFGTRSLVATSASSVPEETEQIGETTVSVSMDPSAEARVSGGVQLLLCKSFGQSCVAYSPILLLWAGDESVVTDSSIEA
jgi:hypothetical protein